MPFGPGAVLALVRAGTAQTRSEIAAYTGLSRVTVTQRVDTLLDRGYIREAGSRSSSGGRRAAQLEFNASHSMVAAIAVETTHARIAVTDLVGSVLARTDVSAAVEDGPEVVIRAAVEATNTLLRETSGPGAVSGVGIALPSPIDPSTSRPSQPPMLPGWDAYPVADHLTDELGIDTVVVENDANAMALGEQSLRHPDCPSLCFVKVSTGIGTGIVVNGRIYTGIDGGAGDIGHVRLPDSDALCRCGRRGCLAAVASGGAIARALAEQGIDARSGRDVAAELNRGNQTALQLTHEAGRRLGEVLATVVCLVNPGVLIIGGALASTVLISGIRETLYPIALPRATRHLDIRLSQLGDDAALQGIARLVVDRRFDEAVIDAETR